MIYTHLFIPDTNICRLQLDGSDPMDRSGGMPTPLAQPVLPAALT